MHSLEAKNQQRNTRERRRIYTTPHLVTYQVDSLRTEDYAELMYTMKRLFKAISRCVEQTTCHAECVGVETNQLASSGVPEDVGFSAGLWCTIRRHQQACAV